MLIRITLLCSFKRENKEISFIGFHSDRINLIVLYFRIWSYISGYLKFEMFNGGLKYTKKDFFLSTTQ